MTKTEAAIVSAYTGVLIGEFADMHKYAEEVMKQPIFTHEFGSKTFVNKLKASVKQDFISINVN